MSNNRKRPTVEVPKLKEVKPAIVNDLEQLEALNAEPVICDVIVKGKPFRFEGRRLLPFETVDVKLLLKRAIPPVIPATSKEDEDRYNYEDPQYLEQHEGYRRKARALVLWRTFPHFQKRAAKRGEKVSVPESTDEITAFIEHLNLDDDILETLYRQVTSDIAELQKFVNFILGSNSPKS